MAPLRLISASAAAAGWVVTQAQAPPSVVSEPWFVILNTLGWPSLALITQRMGWWHMGKCECPEPGVDPSFKEIALRSIENNEQLVVELRESRQRRGSDHR